jgi:hypothetical protein
MPRAPKALAAVVLVVALGLSGCNDARQPAAPSTPAAFSTIPNWPATQGGLRFRWSSAEGIDLETGIAVPLRAYVESHELIVKTYDMSAGYPGFERAVPGPQWRPRTSLQMPWIPDPLTPPDISWRDQRWFGDVYFHILRIKSQDNKFRVTMCTNGNSVYKATPDNRYELRGRAGRKLPWMITVEMTDREPRSGSNPPPDPAGPQEGPQPAPLGDVFGRWTITRRSGDGRLWWYPNATKYTEEPDGEELLRRCETEMPIPADQRPDVLPEFHDSAPPMEPAVPGWPALAQ